jgi:hypothetical protein
MGASKRPIYFGKRGLGGETCWGNDYSENPDGERRILLKLLLSKQILVI